MVEVRALNRGPSAQPATSEAATAATQVEAKRPRGEPEAARPVRSDAARKHVILLTDGHSPRENIFSETLPAMQEDGITVSTISVGAQTATVFLKRIAQAGSGRYYFAPKAKDIPAVFEQEAAAVSTP